MLDRAVRALFDDDEPSLPPGSPPMWKETPQWFSTQLILSLSIGVGAFLIFCVLRTRWEMVYMPRTKLKDFSPAPAHWPDLQKASGASRFFGWIIPTLRTSEFVVLQTVGLDATVLLNFLRMAFMLFSIFSILAAAILMPIFSLRGGTTDSPSPDPPDGDDIWAHWKPDWHYGNGTWRRGNTTFPPFNDILMDPTTSSALQLIFAYMFTAITLAFLHRNFHRFVASRQAFGLQLIHSVSSRTALVTDVPPHLRGDRALAEYFEACGWEVESVSICREVEALKQALDKRTEALLELENAWVAWVGNPASAEAYDPNIYQKNHPDSPTDTVAPTQTPTATEEDPESLRQRYSNIKTTKPRPLKYVRIGKRVDAIAYWEDKFSSADEVVRVLRKTGHFQPTHVAFVTFEDAKSTQEACQVVHYKEHTQVITTLAPEPRDVIWSLISMSRRERQIRDVIITVLMGILLVSWAPPVIALSSLLSYAEIKKLMPWLADLIDKSPRLQALVQNTMPTLALIMFNGLLPFFLEFLCYEQGFRSRSSAEYSLTKKHHLFLLISVLLIVNVTSTYWALVRDLADQPMKIPEKLAMGLQQMNIRHFMVSYVMLQGVGLMPLQLLNIGPLATLVWNRLWAKTPRDFATANAPPIINYGWVYPQALLVFTVTLVYSVVSPSILVFGAIYFGMAYLVFKYKLLFIYFKPWESNGEAWKITFDRLIWALLIFQMFVTGLFSLIKAFKLVVVMVLLIAYTSWWAITMSRAFVPLSKYLALSSICDVQRGQSADEVAGLDDSIVSISQSSLNHKRYAINDDTLYVAPADRRTDYSQPPMSNSFYPGVLNTGRRRYGHPALTGKLPKPWLPAKARAPEFGDGAAQRRGIVLSLRRKVAKRLSRKAKQQSPEDDHLEREGSVGTFGIPDSWQRPALPGSSQAGASSELPSQSTSETGQDSSRPGQSTYASSTISTPSNPWARESTPSTSDLGPVQLQPHRCDSQDLITLGDEHVWDDPDEDDDDSPLDPGETPDVPESPSTYFHHPNRRRTLSGTQQGS